MWELGSGGPRLRAFGAGALSSALCCPFKQTCSWRMPPDAGPGSRVEEGDSGFLLPLTRLAGALGCTCVGAAMVCWSAGEQEPQEQSVAALWFTCLRIACILWQCEPLEMSVCLHIKENKIIPKWVFVKLTFESPARCACYVLGVRVRQRNGCEMFPCYFNWKVRLSLSHFLLVRLIRKWDFQIMILKPRVPTVF